MASFEVSQNVITSDEDSNEMVETNEIVVESETEEVYAGKRKFIRAQKDKYTMEEKIELAKLVQQYKEEYENDKSKKQHQGYVARAVREFYADLKNAKHDDPRLSKAMKMASRAVKRKCDDPAGLETTSSKKSFRATGGGRKVTYPEVRVRLFEWFIDIRGSLKGRLPRFASESSTRISRDFKGCRILEQILHVFQRNANNTSKLFTSHITQFRLAYQSAKKSAKNRVEIAQK